MELTLDQALRAYARTMNTLSLEPLEPLLSEDFCYESQTVFSALESKKAFLDYLRPKLQTIKATGATVFAEMGKVQAFCGCEPCVVLAQNEKENLVAVVFAKIENNRIKRLDVCVAPSPYSASRTGEYPS